MQTRLALNSGFPGLCLPSARITGMYLYLQQYFEISLNISDSLAFVEFG